MLRILYDRRRIIVSISLRIPDVVFSRLQDIKKRYKYRRFYRETDRLRKQGYSYALPIRGGNLCYTMHKIGCYNLMTKREQVKPIYLRTLEEFEELRGKTIKDNPYLQCQACFKT